MLDTLAQGYDSLWVKRLSLWGNRCQAGGQRGRGCVELIVRLLCDYAVYRRTKFFVLLLDFCKAYDEAPRKLPLKVLVRLGCGRVMFGAIRAVYECARSVLRSAAVIVPVGVRHGAPPCCLLCVVYMDQLVRMMKRETGIDDFTGPLHALVLMNDAVLVLIATSREMCLRKLDVAVRYCEEFVMVLNEKERVFYFIFCGDWGCNRFSTNISLGYYCLLHKHVYVTSRLVYW